MRGKEGVRVGERRGRERRGREKRREGVRVGERERDDDNEEGKECCYTLQTNCPIT